MNTLGSMAASMQVGIRNIIAGSLVIAAQSVGIGKALLPVAITAIGAGVDGVGSAAVSAVSVGASVVSKSMGAASAVGATMGAITAGGKVDGIGAVLAVGREIGAVAVDAVGKVAAMGAAIITAVLAPP